MDQEIPHPIINSVFFEYNSGKNNLEHYNDELWRDKEFYKKLFDSKALFNIHQRIAVTQKFVEYAYRMKEGEIDSLCILVIHDFIKFKKENCLPPPKINWYTDEQTIRSYHNIREHCKNNNGITDINNSIGEKNKHSTLKQKNYYCIRGHNIINTMTWKHLTFRIIYSGTSIIEKKNRVRRSYRRTIRPTLRSLSIWYNNYKKYNKKDNKKKNRKENPNSEKKNILDKYSQLYYKIDVSLRKIINSIKQRKLSEITIDDREEMYRIIIRGMSKSFKLHAAGSFNIGNIIYFIDILKTYGFDPKSTIIMDPSAGWSERILISACLAELGLLKGYLGVDPNGNLSHAYEESTKKLDSEKKKLFAVFEACAEQVKFELSYSVDVYEFDKTNNVIKISANVIDNMKMIVWCPPYKNSELYAVSEKLIRKQACYMYNTEQSFQKCFINEVIKKYTYLLRENGFFLIIIPDKSSDIGNISLQEGIDNFIVNEIFEDIKTHEKYILVKIAVIYIPLKSRTKMNENGEDTKRKISDLKNNGLYFSDYDPSLKEKTYEVCNVFQKVKYIEKRRSSGYIWNQFVKKTVGVKFDNSQIVYTRYVEKIPETDTPEYLEQLFQNDEVAKNILGKYPYNNTV